MMEEQQLLESKNPFNPPNTCQEIVSLTRMKCRNKVYSLTDVPAHYSPTGERYDLCLCRLHFSFMLNDPEFRKFASWPLDQNNRANMQLLYDLHDRSKP
jgi:hypothetical protein